MAFTDPCEILREDDDETDGTVRSRSRSPTTELPDVPAMPEVFRETPTPGGNVW